MAKTIALFDSRPCSRCGGSGTYSYCTMYGDTCFKCGGQPYKPGTGYQLTKVGQQAYDAYVKANTDTIPVAEVTVGMLVRDAGRIRTVVEVLPTSESNGGTIVDGVLHPFMGLRYRNVETLYLKDPEGTIEAWTQRVALPPEMEPGTDRKAEMRAFIKACGEVAR